MFFRLFLLFLFFSFFLTISSICPPGTEKFLNADSCFAVALNEYLTSDMASNRCSNQNGRVARLENAFDNAFAVKSAQAVSSYNSFSLGIHLVDGVWRYLDDEFNEIQVPYFNWAPGEPQPTTPFDDHDCAFLNTTDSLWYSQSCGAQNPYFCELPAFKSPNYCTDSARADIFFMVDASSSDNDDLFLIEEVLRAFNSALQTQWYTNSSCDDDDLKRQATRVTGIVYYSSTWFNDYVPDFCSDHFMSIVYSPLTDGLDKRPFADLSVPIQVAQNYTEAKNCNCRRNDSKYGTKQLMVWIPNSDRYDSSTPVSLDLLPSWQHFLLPIKFTKAEATYPLWTDSRMVELVQPDRMNFIPTLAEFLWKFVCEQTGQTGPLPPPPFI